MSGRPVPSHDPLPPPLQSPNPLIQGVKHVCGMNGVLLYSGRQSHRLSAVKTYTFNHQQPTRVQPTPSLHSLSITLMYPPPPTFPSFPPPHSLTLPPTLSPSLKLQASLTPEPSNTHSKQVRFIFLFFSQFLVSLCMCVCACVFLSVALVLHKLSGFGEILERGVLICNAYNTKKCVQAVDFGPRLHN